MTKKIFILFIYFLLTTLASAQLSLEKAIQERVSVSAKQESHNSHPNLLQSLKLVQQSHKINDKNRMNLKTFLKGAESITKFNDNLWNLSLKARDFSSNAFRHKGGPRLLFQGTPNYEKDLKGVKYIFLSESSNHDQIDILDEVISILKKVRKANPSAKILLANEFSVVSNFDTIPLSFATDTKVNIDTLEPYNQVVASAKELGIDVLALDDGIRQYYNDNIYAKIGTKWILWEEKDPQIIDIASDFGIDQSDPNYSKMQMITFQYFLMSNEYGVKLRNQQWVRYIKAVEKFYDTIIVYGGNGHLLSDGTRDSVSLMLNPKNAVVISLYSEEPLPEETQMAYTKRDEIQAKYTPQPVDTEECEEFDEQDTQSSDDDFGMTRKELKVDFHKRNYRRFPGKDVYNWNINHIKNPQSYTRWVQTQNTISQQFNRGHLNYNDWLLFDVYLPPKEDK